MTNEKSKEVKMDTQKNEKLLYEQLEQLAGNLNRKCQQLSMQLREAQGAIAEFNEIGMMLSILDKSEHFSETFIQRCSQTVEDIVTKALDSAESANKETNA